MDAAVWNAIWPDWQLKNVIGRGAYGIVYRAVRILNGTEEESAIKVVTLPRDEIELEQLRAEGLSEEETQKYYASVANEFCEEIQTMKQLNDCVSIVNVQDSAVVPREDSFGWNVLIRMEYLTPFQEYAEAHTLSEEDIIRLGIDLCLALETCEKQHILHRDIKPENIFVDKNGHFKLGDFGIARQLDSTTGAYTRVGTPLYSAPEVAEGKRYDRRADIYSLGLVLYRLLNNGRLPFLPEKRLFTPGDRRNALERRLSGEELPAPAGASECLAAVVLKACEPKLKNRYEDAAAFREALEGVKKRTVPLWWKRPGILIAGVLLALLLVGGGTVLACRGSGNAVDQFTDGVIRTAARIFSGGRGNIPAVAPPASSTDEPAASTDEPASALSTAASNEVPVIIPAESVPDSGEAGTEEAPSTTAESQTKKESDTVPSSSLETSTEQTPADESTAEQTSSDKAAETTAHVHSFGEWTVTRQASCTAAGERLRRCSCGETQQEEIPAAGHSYGGWTVVKAAACTEAGQQQRTCSRCGNVQTEPLAAIGHAFGEWTVVSPASCTKEGTQQHVCSRCKATEKQAISALGHKMQNGVCTRCGESIYQFTINADQASYTLTAVRGNLDTSKKGVLPDSYQGLPVTRIKDGLFSGWSFNGGLQLPSKLNYIGEHTFTGCVIAGTLVIPGTVKTIAEWAFSSANIGEIIISEGVVDLKSVSFGSLSGRPSLTVPSTVQGYDNAFSMTASTGITHFATLTINSQSLLDSLGSIGSCLVDTIKLGPAVSGYSVKGGCLIRNSSGTLLKAATSFTIPTDGSVKIIDGMPFFTDFNGNISSSLYEIRLPEGVKRVVDAAYSSSIQTVYLPHSLEYIYPDAFRGGSPKNIIYSGTIEEWIAITDRVEGEYKYYWSGHAGLEVGCTDGVLYYDTDHWVKR